MKLVDNKVVEALIKYLAGRPYSEVYQVMPMLIGAKDSPVEESDE